MILNRSHLWSVVFGLAALAALKGSWDLGRVMLLEAQGAIDSDSSIYFAMGRGILNGLTPYIDLFETKPPGMFLLSALSLLLSGSEILALALQLFVFAAIPVLLALYAWKEAAHHPQIERAALALSAYAAGIGVALYLEERAGGIQSESFGAFFGFVFLLLATRDSGKFSWKRALLLAIPLLFAIGIKEPFGLAIFAGAIALLGISSALVRSFFLPLCIAAAIGLATMATLGWLLPYIELYLPALKGHVNGSPFDPMFVRGFTPARLFGNLTIFYTAPLLGWLLGAIWLALPIFRDRRPATYLDLGLTLVQSFAAFCALMFAFFFIVTWNVERQGFILSKPINPFPLWIYALIVAAALALLALQWMRGRLRLSTEAILAIYLTAAAVGVSVYARNHFAFAVPAYLALLLAFFRYASRPHAHLAVVLPVFALVIAGSLLYMPSTRHLAELADRKQYVSWAHAETTKKADALLTACDADRYGMVRAYTILAFTKHSPLGPLLEPSFFFNSAHLLVLETDRRIRDEADIVFLGGTPEESLRVFLEENFTEEPPACAKGLVPIEGVETLFRSQKPT